MRRLFGTDGVRGVANEDVSCERSMQIGRALGTVLSEKNRYKPTVLIARDTRVSSPMLSNAIVAGLLSVGANVVDLGVLPTPAVAYLVREYGAKAGVMISASHNPYQYNGIKIFGEGGYKFSDELEEQIEAIVLDNTPPYRLATSAEIGRKLEMPSAREDYVNYITSHGKSLEGLRIGIDTSNGSAAIMAEKIFRSLGAECHMLADSPDGVNINCDCGSTSLDSLKKLVRDERLDLGVAFDGDADRCLCVDEDGYEVDGDFIMAILAKKMKDEGRLQKNTVVGTVMTNYGFTKFCEEYDIKYIATKVGDRYVLEMMNQEGYSLGGEQSGHIIFRDYATTGDGQLTAVLLLSYISETKTSLKQLKNVMRKYPQYSQNINATQSDKITFLVDSEIKEILSRCEKDISGRGKIVARPSGTEPYIRIMVEGEDFSETKKMCKSLAEKIKARLDMLK